MRTACCAFLATGESPVNLGDDADTTGAINGQLAGAFYGERGIPAPWRLTLAKRDVIESLAERLHELADILTTDRIEYQR